MGGKKTHKRTRDKNYRRFFLRNYVRRKENGMKYLTY